VAISELLRVGGGAEPAFFGIVLFTCSTRVLISGFYFLLKNTFDIFQSFMTWSQKYSRHLPLKVQEKVAKCYISPIFSRSISRGQLSDLVYIILQTLSMVVVFPSPLRVFDFV